MLVAGGNQDGVRGGPYAELYEPISGTWTAAGNMVTPTPRSGQTATLLLDGNVLVAGGTPNGTEVLASAELYDPQTGAWSATQDMIAQRSSHTATLLTDGTVLMAGGMGSADTSATGLHEPLGSAELYDPARGTWSATASMAAVRLDTRPRCCPTAGCSWRAAMGCEIGIGSVVLASAELYDPGSGN